MCSTRELVCMNVCERVRASMFLCMLKECVCAHCGVCKEREASQCVCVCVCVHHHLNRLCNAASFRSP